MSIEEDLARAVRQIGDLAVTVDRLDAARGQTALEMSRLKALQANLANEQIAAAVRSAGRQADQSAIPPAVEWMTIDDPDRAVEALTELRVWVQQVWVQYDALVSCWPWHPPVVAELMACRRVWVATVGPKASAVAMADWHARYRLATLAAVRARVGACNPTLGHAMASHLYGTDDLRLDDYAGWWALCHGLTADGATAPGLTLKGEA